MDMHAITTKEITTMDGAVVPAGSFITVDGVELEDGNQIGWFDHDDVRHIFHWGWDQIDPNI